MVWKVTSESHYMRDKFPGNPGTGSKPWVPSVIGEHATRAECERHVARIVAANNGVLPSRATFRIVAPDGTTFRAAS